MGFDHIYTIIYELPHVEQALIITKRPVGSSGKTQDSGLNKGYWYFFPLEACKAPSSTIKASQQVEFPALSKLLSMDPTPKVYSVLNNRVLQWKTKSIGNNLCCFVYQWGFSHRLFVHKQPVSNWNLNCQFSQEHNYSQIWGTSLKMSLYDYIKVLHESEWRVNVYEISEESRLVQMNGSVDSLRVITIIKLNDPDSWYIWIISKDTFCFVN